MTQELKLVAGVAPIPGDTLSAEQPLVVVDLMSNGGTGFNLPSDGWWPKLPPIKGGGTFAASQVANGGDLIAQALDNVTEQIQLTLVGQTRDLLYASFRQLMNMAQLAEDFWIETQPQPVYIKWHANGSPHPGYSLVYNLEASIEDIDPTNDDYGGLATFDVALQIKREVIWRAIPPFANPKLATFQIRDEDWHEALGDYSLVSNTYHLKQETIQNRTEWAVGQGSFVSKNFIDIPQADVWGDAPALLQMNINAGAAGLSSFQDSVFIGISNNRTSYTSRSGSTRLAQSTLNAGDNSVLGTDTTLAADTGAPISNNGATGQRSVTTFATATMIERLRWWGNSESPLDTNINKGKYLAFLRARLSTGTTGVNAKITYNTARPLNEVQNTSVPINTAGAGGTGNTTQWGLFYMGTVEIGTNTKQLNLPTGLGLQIPPTSNNDFSISLYAERTSGTASLYVSDLILIPYDGGAFTMLTNSNLPVTAQWIIDGSGYYGRNTSDFTGLTQVSDSVMIAAAQQQGGIPTLSPGQPNRLYFLVFGELSPRLSAIAQDMNVRINIVPCWYGARDK